MNPAAGQNHPIPRRPALGEDVYRAILERIMQLDIRPGARISVDGLARELGVSQTPIREAMARLESQGLVTKTHLVGYRAAPQLDRKQFDDLYALRLLLEPENAALAAGHVTEDDIAGLDALAEQMTRLNGVTEPGAYAEFARLDASFHETLAALGGNLLVVEALARLNTHLHLFRLLENPSITGEAIEEHVAILEALRWRDPDTARRAMEDHLERSRERFLARYDPMIS